MIVFLPDMGLPSPFAEALAEQINEGAGRAELIQEGGVQAFLERARQTTADAALTTLGNGLPPDQVTVEIFGNLNVAAAIVHQLGSDWETHMRAALKTHPQLEPICTAVREALRTISTSNEMESDF